MSEIDTTVDDITTIENDEVTTEAEPEVATKADEVKETPAAKKARLERQLRRVNKELGIEEPKPKEEVAPKAKTSELDEAQLDFFELKGYSDPEEVEVFAKIMEKTGMSHREVLKDDYALAKVKSIRDEKALQDATPSGTKRGGGQDSSLEAAIAKFERTGEYPKDFELRKQVVAAKIEKDNSSLPPWKRR